MNKKYLEFNRVVGIDFTAQLAELLHDKLEDIGVNSDQEVLFFKLYDGKFSDKLDELIQMIIEDLT